MSDEKLKAAGKRSRWILLIIFIICILPVVAAWWMLKGMQEEGGFATSNYGELVTPARPLKDITLKTLEGEDLVISKLRGRWILVVFGSVECSDLCQKNLYKTRQVRLALGNKDMYRVRRLWITNDTSSLYESDWIKEQHPDLLIASEKGKNKEFVNQFALPEAPDPMVAQRIYIIDPVGNIVISYPPDLKAKYILKDLKRLLYVSYIG